MAAKIYFLLVPSNDEAWRITNDPLNDSFRKLDAFGRPFLQIDNGHKSKSHGNLVSFGRDQSKSDVYLGNTKYSNEQCFIYIHPLSGEFILQDKSTAKSTMPEVAGDQ